MNLCIKNKHNLWKVKILGILVPSMIVFGMLVFFHELGHFAFAKISDIKVNEFCLGFGPQIFRIKSRETDYSIRILPLGGYVRLEGEDLKTQDPRAFNNKSVFTRMGVILAGPMMNFCLAILLLAIISFFSGIATTQVTTVPGEPAWQAGIRDKDEIYAIDNERVNSWDEVVELISNKPNDNITVTVLRRGNYLKYNVKTVVEHGTQRGIIGIKTIMIKHSLYKSLILGFQQTFWASKMILKSLFNILSGRMVAEIVGPLGMVHIVGEAAKIGIFQLLYIAALISINLGLFNLLPIPALDGGRGVFLVFELLRGRPVEPEKEGLIHFIGFTLLLFLMVIVFFKDMRKLDLIKQLFRNQ